jgi:uncharacterized protein
MKPIPDAQKKICLFLGLFFSGMILLFWTFLAECLFLYKPLDAVLQYVYRLVFIITFPLKFISYFILPLNNGYLYWPHWVVSCIGTPFCYWGAWKLYIRIRVRINGIRKSDDFRVKAKNSGISRRQFLGRFAKGAACVSAAGLTGYSSLIEPEKLQIRKYRVFIRELPERFDGLSIVHISDTHYGPFNSTSYLEDMISKANKMKPDLVMLTGDFVSGSGREVLPGLNIFKKLESTYGSIAVLGNHDFREGLDLCRKVFPKIGVRLIENERFYLGPDGISDLPLPGDSICIAGVGDLWRDKDFSMTKSLSGIHEGIPCILLSHNPDVAEMVEPDHRVDLILSGHTHGGQVRVPFFGFPFIPSDYGDKYLGGFCQGPRCPVIVSRGVGLVGIPFRFMVPPEIALITLRKEPGLVDFHKK